MGRETSHESSSSETHRVPCIRDFWRILRNLGCLPFYPLTRATPLFSATLWAISVLGWPNKDHQRLMDDLGVSRVTQLGLKQDGSCFTQTGQRPGH